VYILRKKYGMDSREVNTPQFLLWVRKTVRLIRGGYSPELAGDISARQIFRTCGHEGKLAEIEVEEILEFAQEHFSEQLDAIRDDKAEPAVTEATRPVLIGSQDRAWPGRIQKERGRFVIDSRAPVREGQRLAIAYERDDQSRVTTKEAVVGHLVEETDDLLSTRRFGVQLRETRDSPSSTQGD